MKRLRLATRRLRLNARHFSAEHEGARADPATRHLVALDYFNRALAVNGDAPDTLSNRGVVYQKTQSSQRGLADYEKAVALNPAHVVALVNLGTLLHERGLYREAIEQYEAAITVEPDNADAHFNKALAHVFLGDFLTGWAEYEWRWKKANQRAEYSKFKQPRWLGETPLNGKRILIHAEQGLGDTLHFVRYVRDVEALGATVYLEVQKPLKSLLANVVGAAQVFAQGEPLAAFDVHCPLLSLPHAMRTTKDTIPANVPYIFAPQSQVDLWRDKLPPSTAKKRIGLVCKASQKPRPSPTARCRSRHCCLCSREAIASLFRCNMNCAMAMRPCSRKIQTSCIWAIPSAALRTPPPSSINWILSFRSIQLLPISPARWRSLFGFCSLTQEIGIGSCKAAAIAHGIRRRNSFDRKKPEGLEQGD